MATIGLPDKRILKQLLQTMYVLTVCAIVVALKTSYIFYQHVRWHALVIEVLKIGFLVMATGISTSKRFNRIETVPTKTSLILGMILMMVSIVSDLLLSKTSDLDVVTFLPKNAHDAPSPRYSLFLLQSGSKHLPIIRHLRNAYI